jgi:hemerythrin-like domain-containing protein
MSDLDSIKQRLMREEPRRRLGHLAADLLRIANFIERGFSNEAKPIIRESKWFAEWIAADVDFETQQLLADAQSFLAVKEVQEFYGKQSEKEMKSTAATVKDFSDEFLKRSGLLDQ